MPKLGEKMHLLRLRKLFQTKEERHGAQKSRLVFRSILYWPIINILSRKGSDCFDSSTNLWAKILVITHYIGQSWIKEDLVPKKFENYSQKLSAKTKWPTYESFVNQFWNSLCILLALSYYFLFDGRDTNIAFVDFLYTLKKEKMEFPYFYNKIFDRTGSNPHKIAKNKILNTITEEAKFLSKSDRIKLPRLYGEGKAAYGSVHNLQNASRLSKNKVTNFS